MPGGGAERTSGGNSDASSASGAPTCASHRMRPRIPEQCARGAPTTAAVGYCSVLCGNGTACSSTRRLLATPLGCWMARMQSRETRTMHRAARTSNQRCAANIVADDAPDGTEGYSRGAQGYSRVLKGTRILDRMHASTLNADHAPCSTHVQPAMRSKHRRRRRAGPCAPDGTAGYSEILGCWTASMQRAQWRVQQ
jgi:hypothetical protein